MGRSRLRLALIGLALASVLLRAQTPAPSAAATQLQIGDLFSRAARFRDAADAYRRALDVAAAADDASAMRRAMAGIALMKLRIGDFPAARSAAEQLVAMDHVDPSALALYGDALWSSGLFDEAEQQYDAALHLDASHGRAHHGRARALTARSRLGEAMAEAQTALQLSPRDPELHYTVGFIYEREGRFDLAAEELGNYVSLLPDKDRSDTAQWTRAEIRFLSAFAGRTPLAIAGAAASWTIPIRIEHDKVLVRIKVNGGRARDFVLDTGAERIVVSRELASQRGIAPVTAMQSAGVGDIGLRGLEVGRIDTLEIGDLTVHDVPCLIKNPPLGGLPSREPESFSPLALGLSMRIDYARRQLVIARSLPDARYATELPLRLYRLATVRGVVNGQPATFVVDTGGEVISISRSTAGLAAKPDGFRRIPLKVYGTSGWDNDAFLMPNVDLDFSSIHFSKIPVVVLNLRAPSALLGFQIGGIVGHTFLSRYRVSIDLARSVVGLDTNPSSLIANR